MKDVLAALLCVTVQPIFLKISHPGPTSSAKAFELLHKRAAPFQLDRETQPSCLTLTSAFWLAAARTQERSWYKPYQRHLSACPELLTNQAGIRASNPGIVGLFLSQGTGAAEEHLLFLWHCPSVLWCLTFPQHPPQSLAQTAKLKPWDWPYWVTGNSACCHLRLQAWLHRGCCSACSRNWIPTIRIRIQMQFF